LTFVRSTEKKKDEENASNFLSLSLCSLLSLSLFSAHTVKRLLYLICDLFSLSLSLSISLSAVSVALPMTQSLLLPLLLLLLLPLLQPCESRVCDVTSYGAKSDGSNATLSVLRAMADCAADGDSWRTIYIPTTAPGQVRSLPPLALLPLEIEIAMEEERGIDCV
jgi:hypothetical protein